MSDYKFTFELFPASMAISRLHPKAPFPSWAKDSELTVMARTPDEVSIICAEVVVPKGIIAERGFKLLRIKGPLDFDMIGVLSSVLSLLSEAQVSVLAFSTYDTDYIMVREKDLEKALAALYKKGHTVITLPAK